MLFTTDNKFLLISNWRCGSSKTHALFTPYSEYYTLPPEERNPVPATRKLLGLNYHAIVHNPARFFKKVWKQKGWDWDQYVKITTIRNPWDRAVSLYFYMRRKNGLSQPFDKFIARTFSKHGNNTQTMVEDKEGNVIVDHIIRLENYEAELKPVVQQHWDFDFDYATKSNTTDHEHYSHYFDDREDLIDLVRSRFEFDVEYGPYTY